MSADLHDRRTADDHEQAGQNEDDHHHGEQSWQSARSFFEACQHFLAHIAGQTAQAGAERGAVLQCLDQRACQPAQADESAALAEIGEGNTGCVLDVHFIRGQRQLGAHHRMDHRDLVADAGEGGL